MSDSNRSWLVEHADDIAKWMFIVSTVMTSADGTVSMFRGDYLVGVLGLAAALASAAGAIVTNSFSKAQDEQNAAR
ncbi:MAG: hypothetical protein U1E93_01090 [Alphaproteobacteria bacterium]